MNQKNADSTYPPINFAHILGRSCLHTMSSASMRNITAHFPIAQVCAIDLADTNSEA